MAEFLVYQDPQFVAIKCLAEPVHRSTREFICQPEFVQLPFEEGPLITRIGDLAWFAEIPACVHDFDPVVRMDNACTKCDRGEVPFTCGSQAEDEP